MNPWQLTSPMMRQFSNRGGLSNRKDRPRENRRLSIFAATLLPKPPKQSNPPNPPKFSHRRLFLLPLHFTSFTPAWLLHLNRHFVLLFPLSLLFFLFITLFSPVWNYPPVPPSTESVKQNLSFHSSYYCFSSFKICYHSAVMSVPGIRVVTVGCVSWRFRSFSGLVIIDLFSSDANLHTGPRSITPNLRGYWSCCSWTRLGQCWPCHHRWWFSGTYVLTR